VQRSCRPVADCAGTAGTRADVLGGGCAGDRVTAGTVNCDGCLTVVAEASGQQTVIADIVRLVEQAQVRRT
jgi:hypothetical protein